MSMQDVVRRRLLSQDEYARICQRIQRERHTLATTYHDRAERRYRRARLRRLIELARMEQRVSTRCVLGYVSQPMPDGSWSIG